MQLEAINVSKPKLRRFGFKFYTTAFLKKTVQGPVSLTQDNLNGDKQADLMNHGGNDKAVYGFSTEHHDYWKQKLGIDHIDFGKFGENLRLPFIHSGPSKLRKSMDLENNLYQRP